MKTIRFYLFFAALFLLAACGRKSPIVGDWKLADIDIEKAIEVFDDQQKDFARTMMTEAFQNVKGRLTISFDSDGKYKIETPLINGDVKSESGKWRLSVNHKKITLKPKTSDKEVHRVLHLSDDKLIMEMNQAGFGDMEMTFERD